jgi:hypothetical protein
MPIIEHDLLIGVHDGVTTNSGVTCFIKCKIHLLILSFKMVISGDGDGMQSNIVGMLYICFCDFCFSFCPEDKGALLSVTCIVTSLGSYCTLFSTNIRYSYASGKFSHAGLIPEEEVMCIAENVTCTGWLRNCVTLKLILFT